jgi:hypothetical protein
MVGPESNEDGNAVTERTNTEAFNGQASITAIHS